MLDFIRGAVRPAVLTVSVLATIAFIATRTPIPEAWWALVSGAMTYYFLRRQQTDAVPHG